MSDLVHLALNNYTACKQFIVGITTFWSEDESKCSSGYGTQVNHTCLIEDVTCEACKKSDQYSEYLKMIEEEE